MLMGGFVVCSRHALGAALVQQSSISVFCVYLFIFFSQFLTFSAVKSRERVRQKFWLQWKCILCVLNCFCALRGLFLSSRPSIFFFNLILWVVFAWLILRTHRRFLKRQTLKFFFLIDINYIYWNLDDAFTKYFNWNNSSVYSHIFAVVISNFFNNIILLFQKHNIILW